MQLGAACDDRTDCAKDTQCKSGICLALAKPGESCADTRCAAAGRCDETKTCRAYLPIGAACSGANDCQYQCYDKKCAPSPYDDPKCSR